MRSDFLVVDNPEEAPSVAWLYTDSWHECWTAGELVDAPLLERWRVPSGHERTTQLFAIRLGEPDPGLFAPLDPH